MTAKYEIKNGKVYISKKAFAKVSKDYKGKDTMTVLDPKTGATVNMPVVFEEVGIDEARQLKNPKKEVMVVKKGEVIVINKKDAKEYLNKGWELAEEAELDEATKWKIGDGRPRGAAHIENIRYWDLSKDELQYIMKDADAAMEANPTGRKFGKYADEVNDANTVLGWRKKNGIKEDVDLDEASKEGTIKIIKTKDGKFQIQKMTKGKFVDIGKPYNSAKEAEKFRSGHPDLFGEDANLDEARQLKDPKKEVMVVKKGEVIVIDKKDQDNYMKKGWKLAEGNDLDEGTKQVLAHGGKGQYKAVSDGGVVNIMYKGKVISSGDFDRGADGWFLNIKGEKGQKFFDDAQKMVDYFAKNKITEEIELDEHKGKKPHKHPHSEKGELATVDEGKMKELHGYIQDGKPAEQIAKIMKVDVKTVKALMSGYMSMGQHESAASDARRAMSKDKDFSRRDSADDDTAASDDDVKAASKNILMQLRKAVSLKSYNVEFGDGKHKVDSKIAQAVQNKYNSMRRPADKEKYQMQIAKSYKGMLQSLKAGYGEQKESILHRIDRKLKERKNG